MLFYTFEIYFDFSGYSNMASGVSLMLNLTLPMNFNSPYKAVSIRDYWKRWHMPLTNFLTKYIYIPLGGSKKGMAFTYINTMIVISIRFHLPMVPHIKKNSFKIQPKVKNDRAGVRYRHVFDESSRMRTDLGAYPTYLYDNNPFNDVRYLFNKDVVFKLVYQMAVDNDNETSRHTAPHFGGI